MLLSLSVVIVCHGHCSCCSSIVDCEGCLLLGVWAVCCCFQVPSQGPCSQHGSCSEPLFICGWLLGNCASCVPRSVVWGLCVPVRVRSSGLGVVVMMFLA